MRDASTEIIDDMLEACKVGPPDFNTHGLRWTTRVLKFCGLNMVKRRKTKNENYKSSGLRYE